MDEDQANLRQGIFCLLVHVPECTHKRISVALLTPKAFEDAVPYSTVPGSRSWK